LFVQTAATDGYLDILNEAWRQHLAPRSPDAPTVVSLFAGCGGSSLGYSMAGYRELLAVEWDDGAVATFRLNFPDVPVYHGDIVRLSIDECLELADIEPGKLDVLDGSPPCQGFSTAGKRRLDDPRNRLFTEYVRLLRGLQPQAFVVENVWGLVQGRMKLVFAEIVQELRDSGYNVSARLLDARYFHVPQRRRRIIFVGTRRDLGIAPSHPAPQSRPYTVKEAIGDLPHKQDASIQHTWIDEKQRSTATYPLALRARQGEYYAGHQKRIEWDEPFPTILKPSGVGIPSYLRNAYCHPLYTRTFSVRELARACSFPDQFRFAGNQGAFRIGNAVPPLFMRAIAQHVKELLKNV